MREVKVQKWGNSYGIRLSKPQLERLQVKEGTVLYMEEKKNSLVLKLPTKEQKLKELLAQIPDDYELEIIDWGKPVGNEFW